MRSFNDWYFDLFESGNGACLNQQEIAEEAWDYRQNEVDELQKRVDDALKLVESCKESRVLLIGELEQALKGDQ